MHPTPSPNGHGPEPGLRIVAADADPAVCQFYRELLPALGHKAVVVGCGRQAADLCRAMLPDLLITDTPTSRLGDPEHQVPVIVVSAAPAPDGLGSDHSLILAYMGRPIQPAALRAAVAVAARLRGLETEAAELRQALEDRKVIDRAKGMLARYAGLGEETAYTRMRKAASHENRTLVEVARSVVAAGEVFHVLDEAGEARQAGSGHARLPDRRVGTNGERSTGRDSGARAEPARAAP